jgi:hypothetical protein
MGSVQLRCPTGPGRLLAILRQNGERPRYLDDNTVEFACSDCARDLRKQGYEIARVLHRFNFAGDLVETVEIARGEEARGR